MRIELSLGSMDDMMLNALHHPTDILQPLGAGVS